VGLPIQVVTVSFKIANDGGGNLIKLDEDGTIQSEKCKWG